MAVVVIGCLLAPLHSFRDLAVKRYANRSIVWTLVAAVSTVGFTMFDKVAAEHVARSFPGYLGACRYAYALYLSWCLSYWGLLLVFKAPEVGEEDVGWKLPALGGLCTVGSYSLVLWAFQIADEASYVVAFRQFSIVIGVVVAFIAYKERGLAVRLTAVALIAAGLVMIGLWGK
jgi:uncharacterized membrane protein